MPDAQCTTCGRDPQRMNSKVAECSHVDCTHRRHAWSERPTGYENLQHDPVKKRDEKVVPLDQLITE